MVSLYFTLIYNTSVNNNNIYEKKSSHSYIYNSNSKPVVVVLVEVEPNQGWIGLVQWSFMVRREQRDSVCVRENSRRESI